MNAPVRDFTPGAHHAATPRRGEPLRPLIAVAGAAWLLVAASGVWSAAVEGEEWVAPYTAFMLSLIVAAIVSVSVVARSTRGARHPWLRIVGLVVAGLGCLMSVVAWAMLVWMFLLGSGFALIALSTRPPMRRAVACLSVAQLVGIPAFIAVTEIEVGTADSYGDFPAADAIALVITVGVTVLGLTLLSKYGETEPVG